MKNIPANLKNHANFNADDYAYFKGKGYTNQEIKAKWDSEAAAGNPACRWDTKWAKQKLNAYTK